MLGDAVVFLVGFLAVGGFFLTLGMLLVILVKSASKM